MLNFIFRRHSNKTSHFLKKVTTETAKQYSNEQTEAYQSLAPSPDSLTERGMLTQGALLLKSRLFFFHL